ncbi:MAG: uridine kinase, partial [Acetivibrio ethanolgignens]
MHDIVIIGVAGGSASGKTTVANRLKEEFAGSVELISHDCYYKAHDDMPFEERCKLNYDHPTA